MKLTVCIGSSCHLKGSRLIVEQFQKLIADNHLEEKVELVGTFCLGKCQTGVSVKLDETVFSLNPEDVKSFFEKEILSRV